MDGLSIQVMRLLKTHARGKQTVLREPWRTTSTERLAIHSRMDKSHCQIDADAGFAASRLGLSLFWYIHYREWATIAWATSGLRSERKTELIEYIVTSAAFAWSDDEMMRVLIPKLFLLNDGMCSSPATFSFSEVFAATIWDLLTLLKYLLPHHGTLK